MKKWLFSLLLWFPALPVYADLPEMEDPSRGQGDGIMETLQNYGYDIVILMTLGICAVGFGCSELEAAMRVASANRT